MDKPLESWRWRCCRQARSRPRSLGRAMSWLLGWRKGTNPPGYRLWQDWFYRALTRDVRLLGGEFQSSFAQEGLHQRSHLVLQEFLRTPGDDEVIRISDQVDFRLPAQSGGLRVAFPQLPFQAIQRQVRQHR